MPYFTFKVFSTGRLEPVSCFDDYRSAKREVTALRHALETGDDYTVRMILAGDSGHAERLLSEKREPRPLGEDG